MNKETFNKKIKISELFNVKIIDRKVFPRKILSLDMDREERFIEEASAPLFSAIERQDPVEEFPLKEYLQRHELLETGMFKGTSN